MKVTSLLFLSTVAVASSFTVDAVREVGKGEGFVEGIEQFGKLLSGEADGVVKAANPNTIKGLIQNNPDIQKVLNEYAATQETAAKSRFPTSEGNLPSHGRMNDGSNFGRRRGGGGALTSVPDDPAVVIQDLTRYVESMEGFQKAPITQQMMARQKIMELENTWKKEPNQFKAMRSKFMDYLESLYVMGEWVITIGTGVALLTFAGLAIALSVNKNTTENANRTMELQLHEQLNATETNQSVELFEKEQQ